MSDRDDERAVEAFLAGETGAFDELVSTHRRRVFGICFRYAGNHHDADDLVQEVFLRAFRGLPRFRSESRFTTWLYRIAVNTCLNWVQSRKRAAVELPDDIRDPSPSVAERMGRRQQADRVRRAVTRLPDRQRMTLVLRIYEELPHREIAELMGCPVGTAKANLFFALKNLRKYLGAESDPEADLR